MFAITGKSGIDNCLMRCGGRIVRLTDIWSAYDECIRRPVGICDQCGHVQIARLFDAAEYAALNDRFFSKYKGGMADVRASKKEQCDECEHLDH